MNTVVVYLVSSLLSILEFLFLARAVMSWFAQGSGSKDMNSCASPPNR